MPERPITIAIDAMGGYNAPDDIIAAVAQASRVGDPNVFFCLVGDESIVTEKLYQTGHNPERISLVHAPTSIGMSEPAALALQQKPDASVAITCSLVAEGYADAVVTAGHPGAAILSAHAYFGHIPGVRRTALAAVYPTPRVSGPQKDRFSLILDVGATLRATPENLLDFALMGTAYARIVKGIAEPRVGLLSNSREATIGPPEVVQAHDRLRDHPEINFCGMIEGHHIPRGDHDVVVCEGYVGDVAIKLLEGAGDAAMELARSAYERHLRWRLGLRLLAGGLKKIKTAIEFEEYGGAPLLGLDQVMILAHPGSTQKAFGNALRLAIKNVRAQLPEVIADVVRPVA